MKQYRLFAWLVVLALGLVACGGGEEPAADTAVSPTAVPPTPIIAEPSAVPTLPPAVVSESTDAAATDSGPDTGASAVRPTATPETAVTGPWLATQFGYGVQVHGVAGIGDPGQTMDTVRNQLGLDWVKVQVQWWLVKPEPDYEQWFFYDSVVEQAHKHGLRLMLSVVGAPEWSRAAGGENGPPDDYNQ